MKDFIAIGDTTIDEFIKLEEAQVHCGLNHEDCTISMAWGDKIPYEFAIDVPAVGNAANAAVAAARLGLTTGFISNIGDDAAGQDILATFAREDVDTRYIATNAGKATNHDYVLLYDSERTILVKHEDYAYAMPADLTAPRWIYLSSAGRSAAFHAKLAAWVAAHPETKLAFQPSTFEMSMDRATIAPLYTASELVACNKEEAERILGVGPTDIRKLLSALRALGSKVALITDGPNGAYASDDSATFFVPMYPDPRPPLDRTGAGDAMTATVVAALALGLPLSEALAWGPVNSMSVVQEIGAQKGLLTRTAIEQYLTDAPASYRVTPL
jgi:sugar/nucleoside kinase (ribokinase family)